MQQLLGSVAGRHADDHILRFQLGELRIIEAGFTQHLVGVFAEPRRRPPHRPRCARTPARGPEGAAQETSDIVALRTDTGCSSPKAT